MTTLVYLHGFASGPSSRKAQFFREGFENRGYSVRVPALEGDDFEHMTITSQMALVRQTVDGECILMGSSMGGYLAALHASESPQVKAVVLLAPAFYFPDRWEENVGEEIATAWRSTGRREVFHYARQRPEWIGYGLLEDAKKYDPAPSFNVPGLILHGKLDDVVPVEHSRRYVAEHPNVTLREYVAGHELTEVLPQLWEETWTFVKSL